MLNLDKNKREIQRKKRKGKRRKKDCSLRDAGVFRISIWKNE